MVVGSPPLSPHFLYYTEYNSDLLLAFNGLLQSNGLGLRLKQTDQTWCRWTLISVLGSRRGEKLGSGFCKKPDLIVSALRFHYFSFYPHTNYLQPVKPFASHHPLSPCCSAKALHSWFLPLYMLYPISLINGPQPKKEGSTQRCVLPQQCPKQTEMQWKRGWEQGEARLSRESCPLKLGRKGVL